VPESTPSAGLGALTDRVFAAVLFDMDGTLIDSTPAVERSWLKWAAEFGVQLPTESWHGIPAAQIVATLLPTDRIDEGVRRIEEIETSDVEGILVLPGSAEALAALPGGRAAIVTSCVWDLATARMAATGITAPAVIVTADQVTIGKPDPAPFLLAATRLGVDPADCLVIEDAPAGLTAGRAAGASLLAVLSTHTADELDADAVVQNLDSVRFTVTDEGVRVSLA
jgi:sugar-phosphatase